MDGRPLSNVIGFDDAPCAPQYCGPVPLVGAVFAGERLDGVVVGRVERDGGDAAQVMASLVSQGRFAEHVRLVMLQGVAVAGFNVVDVFSLYARLEVPVLVVSKEEPDFDMIRKALLKHIPDGQTKWEILERLGPMERIERLFVQRVGIDRESARATVKYFAIHSRVPEPLRVAHLIAGAIGTGESRGRP